MADTDIRLIVKNTAQSLFLFWRGCAHVHEHEYVGLCET